MANSLQDQLLKAGLADAKQAKKARAGKRPSKGQPKGKKGQRDTLSESAQASRQALAEKAERDRQLNQARKAAAERKALAAQVRQIIEQHRLSREGGEDAYHFTDGKLLRTVYVTPVQREQLARGSVVIVRDGARYELVMAEAAEKVRARDPACVMVRSADEAAEESPAQDDPYAQYKVPDDLMW